MADNRIDMAKLLADTLRAKATSLTTSTLTPLEWGKELGVNTETARNWINKISDYIRKKFK